SGWTSLAFGSGSRKRPRPAETRLLSAEDDHATDPPRPPSLPRRLRIRGADPLAGPDAGSAPALDRSEDRARAELPPRGAGAPDEPDSSRSFAGDRARGLRSAGRPRASPDARDRSPLLDALRHGARRRALG